MTDDLMTNLSEQDREALGLVSELVCWCAENPCPRRERLYADVEDIVRRARAEALREAAEVVSAHVLVMPRISNGILDEVYARDLAFDLKSAVLDLGDHADMPLRATETGLGGSNTCSDVSPGAEDAGRAAKRSRLFADSDEIAGDRAMTRRALGLDDGARDGGA